MIRLALLFALAFVLTIVPLPVSLVHFRPPWVLLLVLYVQFFLPHYLRVSWVLCLGLCLDVLLSSVIGEHAFALLLTCWLAMGGARRFRFFSTLQQMMLLPLFCLTYQSMMYLFDAALGYHPQFIFAIGSTLLSVLCWPWIKSLSSQSIVVTQRR